MKHSHLRYLFMIGLLLGLAMVLAACGQTVTPAPTEPPRPTAVITPEGVTPEATEETTGQAEAVEVPFLEQWTGSGHAQADAPAFTHWNEDDPQEIPAECAKCHSTPGFQDYVGADGSAFGAVDAAHPVGTTVTCVACHNDATLALDTVVFPSGVELTGVSEEAVCMTCHQGTASKTQVDEAIAASGAADEDTVAAEMGFVNIHYYAAAVTRYGTLVKGGYEYDGQAYDAMFEHVEGVQTCNECHDPHTLEVKVDTCAGCHQGVASVEDLRNIRSLASTPDYDGDGDTAEGVFFEIEGLRDMLYQAIQAYASEVSGTPIVYSAEAYPYFFIDTNADGEAGDDEAAFPNRFNAWTPRLAKAAYNYQTSIKDPGMYAHGGKYIIELVYDSIDNLNQALGTPVSLETAHRTDVGHFAGSGEAFRHWDEEEGGLVATACVKCHTSEGLPMALENAGATIAIEGSNGLKCESCHSDVSTTFARYEVESVRFPSGATVSFEQADNNLCLQCHQGRESTVSVNTAINGLPADQPNERLRFRNIHYFAAGATLFGTEVKGAYEFAGKEYLGRFTHVESFDTCTECHDAHALTFNVEACAGCHGTEEVEAIRGESSTADYDGDGDTEEGIAGEIETMEEKLFEAIQAYAANTLNAPILYNPARHPYFFADANANGELDEDEAQYASWSPKLLQSAYNYQYAQKDPGDFAHNAKYILQVLYDSIQNVGGSVTGMTRP